MKILKLKSRNIICIVLAMLMCVTMSQLVFATETNEPVGTEETAAETRGESAGGEKLEGESAGTEGRYEDAESVEVQDGTEGRHEDAVSAEAHDGTERSDDTASDESKSSTKAAADEVAEEKTVVTEDQKITSAGSEENGEETAATEDRSNGTTSVEGQQGESADGERHHGESAGGEGHRGESAGDEGAERQAGGERQGGGPGGAGGMQQENDETVQAALDEAADKFIQAVFTDPDTGYELEYSLYIPENASAADADAASAAYPLIMFIPDSTGAGKSAADIVSSYYGAAVWATAEDQAEHPCFVFVPAFTDTVVDDNWNTSDQIETAVKAIAYLTETYNIDTSRLYTTGQSMGCMTSLYLNSKYPDLFAASLYVSGQWDISVLDNLENQNFFYITSAGDSKASGGQSEVMAMFDADGAAYTYGEWNCKDTDQEAKAQALIAQGLPNNMIRFEAEFTDDSGNTQSLTHMLSFNYAYKIKAVRDWLFAQSKTGEEVSAGSAM